MLAHAGLLYLLYFILSPSVHQCCCAFQRASFPQGMLRDPRRPEGTLQCSSSTLSVKHLAWLLMVSAAGVQAAGGPGAAELYQQRRWRPLG